MPKWVLLFLAVAMLVSVCSVVVLLGALGWWYVQHQQPAAAPTTIEEVQ